MLASLRVKRGMGEAEDSGEGEEERVREVPRLVGSRRLYSGSGSRQNLKRRSLESRSIYMRWETYGWQLNGKITGVVTEATPRLFKKSNFRLV